MRSLRLVECLLLVGTAALSVLLIAACTRGLLQGSDVPQPIITSYHLPFCCEHSCWWNWLHPDRERQGLRGVFSGGLADTTFSPLSPRSRHISATPDKSSSRTK